MNPLKKALFITLGSVSIFLGIIGIILPLLPTTPFLLLAAYCYARSSKRLYEKLLHTKYLGTYIKNYRAGKGIPFKSKIIAVLVLWISVSFSIFLIVPLAIVQILLFIVAAYITYYIMSLKTYKKQENSSIVSKNKKFI
ncbi:YbaN family protein [Alteribacillus sp. YIM 98480]|uniref:YbaN family protein n=1 Tax=Alteribacillus sp. YIM 98480 TaxID=2606599 RepID=UPI00131AF91F|nr:YbaN family protein [Alteribacillus sp. YIM 98480]